MIVRTRSDELALRIARSLDSLEEYFPYLIEPQHWEATSDPALAAIQVRDAIDVFLVLSIFNRDIDASVHTWLDTHISDFLRLLRDVKLDKFDDIHNQLIVVEATLSISASALLQPNAQESRSFAPTWLGVSSESVSRLLKRTPRDVASTFQAAILNTLDVFDEPTPPGLEFGWMGTTFTTVELS